ncbi:MAG TPA: carboxypeptidase-like regulatory domain-containing protein [Planctomycetota bacterium]|nr:carboxypeptidase-like regulatory domain-containing protein [Planctomycetota bacterium]
MTKRGHDGAQQLLRGLAFLQGFLIVVLIVLLLRPGEVAPAQAATAGGAHDTTAGTAAPAATPEVAEAGQTPVADASREATTPAREGGPGGAATTGPAGRAAATAPADLAAPAGTVLYGRVTSETGEDINEGVVWFSRPAENKQVATVSLRTGHNEFAIAGLAPGQLEFRTRASGYKEQRETIDIGGEPRLRRDIVLAQSWLLTVKVLTPEGKPLHEALREAMKERPMLRHVEVSAVVTAAAMDGDFPPTPLREVDFGLGRWRSATGIGAMVRGGPKQAKDVAGTVEIDTKRAVWASAVLRHRVLASAQVEPGQAEVVLTVALDQVFKDLGTIRGRVVDAVTGAAVANAAIGFGDLQSSGSAGKSDEQGRFEVKDLRPGLLDVEINGDKRMARRDLILLQPGQVLEIGDVPVFEFRTIKGRCEGLHGKAEQGRIAYTPLEPSNHPAVRRYTDSAQIAADGTFSLHVPDGRYLLRASGAGSAVTEIDTRTLGGEPLVLHLAKDASLRVDVQSNGEPWELAVFDGGGREVYRRALRNDSRFPLQFVPGDYRVELTDRHGKVQRRQIHLGADGVDLRVP